MTELREGARVRFKDAQAAAVYGMPADAVGTVTDWLMLPMGDKRWVVVFVRTKPPYTALVKDEHIEVTP